MKDTLKFKKVNTAGDYDFYIAVDENGKPLYNIMPKDSPIPGGGYYDKEYVAKARNVDSINFTVAVAQPIMHRVEDKGTIVVYTIYSMVFIWGVINAIPGGDVLYIALLSVFACICVFAESHVFEYLSVQVVFSVYVLSVIGTSYNESEDEANIVVLSSVSR